MIIVSQDKTMSLNLDNIEAIGVGNPLENNDGKFQILVETTSDNQYQIAKYETEERAKEILDDITNTRAIFEIYKCSDANTQNIFDEKMLKENLIFDTYEMPKE